MIVDGSLLVLTARIKQRLLLVVEIILPGIAARSRSRSSLSRASRSRVCCCKCNRLVGGGGVT